VVAIHLPPPTRLVSPRVQILPAASSLVRVFDPTDHGATALSFRSNGPRKRFDHHRGSPRSPSNDPARGIYYGAFSLDGCLVEIFGDNGSGLIETANWHVANVTLKRDLSLLDLRGKGDQNGAWKAGSVEALSKHADYTSSQAWSRYFYETEDIYSLIDGLLYCNAHNGDDAVVLYERARDGLACDPTSTLRLDDPALRFGLLDACQRLGFKPPLP
jgi:RES domain